MILSSMFNKKLILYDFYESVIFPPQSVKNQHKNTQYHCKILVFSFSIINM